MSQKNGAVVWFVGLSGSGKSTIGRIVERRLQQNGIPHAVLDGNGK
ncbi:adenylyl-sulfate kinase [Cohnella sp. LGH]|nr:adenylyl-sulfate kinase [Cohnella sp. LGH]QTH41418.1 adenylyl-sulfate kinase [Cohnella sp. LGH]